MKSKKEFLKQAFRYVLMLSIVSCISFFRTEIQQGWNRIRYAPQRRQAQTYLQTTYPHDTFAVKNITKKDPYFPYWDGYVILCVSRKDKETFPLQLTEENEIVDKRLIYKVHSVLLEKLESLTDQFFVSKTPYYRFSIQGADKIAEELKEKIDLDAVSETCTLELIRAMPSFPELLIIAELDLVQIGDTISDRDAQAVSQWCLSLLENGWDRCRIDLRGCERQGNSRSFDSLKHFSASFFLKEASELSPEYIKQLCTKSRSGSSYKPRSRLPAMCSTGNGRFLLFL